MTPYDTFKFREYPFRWVAVWIYWNLGETLEKLGLLVSKPSSKYGQKGNP